MIAYHGSHQSGLKSLSYSEDNSRFGGEHNLVHGAGIYLTLSKKEALAYATSSLYKINIQGEVFDSTDEEVLISFVKEILNSLKLNPRIINNENIQRIIKQTVRGEASGVVFAKNITDIFLNDESLYKEVLHEKFNDDIDLVCSTIESFFTLDLIKVKHKGNDTEWVICLNHDGIGLEILEEIEIP